MSLRRWSRSEVEYGRRLLNSGLDGARWGREAFLHGGPLAGFVGESIRNAFEPAAIGACIGLLGSFSGSRNKSVGRALAFGLVGGVIGLGASLAWESRRLTASAAGEATRNINRVRDERWMEKHSIAYA